MLKKCFKLRRFLTIILLLMMFLPKITVNAEDGDWDSEDGYGPWETDDSIYSYSVTNNSDNANYTEARIAIIRYISANHPLAGKGIATYAGDISSVESDLRNCGITDPDVFILAVKSEYGDIYKTLKNFGGFDGSSIRKDSSGKILSNEPSPRNSDVGLPGNGELEVSGGVLNDIALGGFAENGLDWVVQILSAVVYMVAEAINTALNLGQFNTSTVDLSISGMMLGRLANGQDSVSWVQFELEKNNPWGFLGASLYKFFRNISYGFIPFIILFVILQSVLTGDAKTRVNIKVLIFNSFITLFLIVLVPQLIDYLIYIRDVISLKIYTEVLHLDSEMNLVRDYKFLYLFQGGLLKALLYLAAIFATFTFLKSYVSIALKQTLYFGTFPIFALLGMRDKKLLSNWTKEFVCNTFVPTIDMFLFAVPMIFYNIASQVATGVIQQPMKFSEVSIKSWGGVTLAQLAGRDGTLYFAMSNAPLSVCIITMFLMAMIVGSRNALLKLFGQTIQDNQRGGAGLLALGLMGARMLGNGVRNIAHGGSSQPSGIIGTSKDGTEHKGAIESMQADASRDSAAASASADRARDIEPANNKEDPIDKQAENNEHNNGGSNILEGESSSDNVNVNTTEGGIDTSDSNITETSGVDAEGANETSTVETLAENGVQSDIEAKNIEMPPEQVGEIAVGAAAGAEAVQSAMSSDSSSTTYAAPTSSVSAPGYTSYDDTARIQNLSRMSADQAQIQTMSDSLSSGRYVHPSQLNNSHSKEFRDEYKAQYESYVKANNALVNANQFANSDIISGYKEALNIEAQKMNELTQRGINNLHTSYEKGNALEFSYHASANNGTGFNKVQKGLYSNKEAYDNAVKLENLNNKVKNLENFKSDMTAGLYSAEEINHKRMNFNKARMTVNKAVTSMPVRVAGGVLKATAATTGALVGIGAGMTSDNMGKGAMAGGMIGLGTQGLINRTVQNHSNNVINTQNQKELAERKAKEKAIAQADAEIKASNAKITEIKRGKTKVFTKSILSPFISIFLPT